MARTPTINMWFTQTARNMQHWHKSAGAYFLSSTVLSFLEIFVLPDYFTLLKQATSHWPYVSCIPLAVLIAWFQPASCSTTALSSVRVTYSFSHESKLPT